MFDHDLKSEPEAATPRPVHVDHPSMTFGEVIDAVNAAPDLRPGVRRNIVSALIRTSALMSNTGLAAIVDVPSIGERFEKLTAGRLKFKSKGSLAAFMSNVRRGLRLAGFTVMPGRYQIPLTPQWAHLLALIPDESCRRYITRFIHFASEQGWLPGEIGDAHIERFRHYMNCTSLKSRASKVVRNTVRSWNRAAESVPLWPSAILEDGGTSNWFYGLPWSEFPALQQDVDAYLESRSAEQDIESFLEDFIDDNCRPKKALKKRTCVNYRDAFLRAASILVKTGEDPASLRSIRDLVSPRKVNKILMFIANRTKRRDGGLLQLLALLLYMAARDWVYRQPSEMEQRALAQLKSMFKKVQQKRRGMSDRTWSRLLAFDETGTMDAYLREPIALAARAKKLPLGPDSARMMRLALFISISIDTLLRPGNVVALDLDQHLTFVGQGRSQHVFIDIKSGIKNDVPHHSELRPVTVGLLQLYLQKYRAFHVGIPCTWLFPRPDGAHWTEKAACDALKDHCDRALGLDVTPHLHRSLGGKIILDDRPGALVEVQHALNHKRLETTAGYYVKLEPSTARARYHDTLDKLLSKRG